MADLGKAYVQVVPSMQGVAGKIGAMLGGVDTAGAGKKMGAGLGSGITGGLSTLKVAFGTLLGNMATKAVSAISSSVDGAISRVDTLNQFPRVMEQMGYSASEAADLIKGRLSPAIDGLPTTLDSITVLAQQMTLALGDMDKGADAAIALNDGLLAYGATAEGAAMATDAMTKMISSGSYDLDRWRTVLENCPPLLNTMAEELLGTGASAEDLRLALKDGSVTTEDFVNALIKLDQEGGEGVEAFSSAVQGASAGIKTSMTNAQTAVTKGVANILDAFNGEDKVIETFFDGVKLTINQFFNALTPVAEQLGQLVGPAVSTFTQGLKDGLDPFTALSHAVGELPGPLGDLATGFMDIVESAIGPFIWHAKTLGGILTDLWDVVSSAFGGIAEGFDELGGKDLIFQAISKAIEAFGQLVGAIAPVASQILGDLGRVVGNLLAGAFEVVADAFGAFADALEGGGSIFDAITTALSALNPVVEFLGQLMGGLIEFFGTLVSAALPPFVSIVQALWPILQQVASIFGQIALAVMDVANYLAGFLGPIFQGIADLVSVAAPVIQLVIETAWSAIKSITDAVWPGIQSLVSGAASFIMAAIEALTPVVEALGSVFQGLQPIFAGVASVVGSILGPIFDAIGSFLQWLADNVVPLVADGFSRMGETLGGVAEFLGNTIGPALEWLADLIGAVAEGLGTFFGWIGDGLNWVGEQLGFCGDEAEEAKGQIDGLAESGPEVSNMTTSAEEDLAGLKGAFDETGASAEGAATDMWSAAGLGSDAMSFLKDDGTVDMEALQSSFGTTGADFSSMTSAMGQDAANATTDVSSAWAGLGDGATSAFQQVSTAATSGMDNVKAQVVAKAQEISAAVQQGWSGLGEITTGAFTGLAADVVTPLQEASASSVTAADALRSGVTSALSSARSAASSALSGLSASARSSMSGVSSSVSQAMSKVTSSVGSTASTVTSMFTSMRSSVTSSASQMSSAVTSAANNMRQSLSTAFSSIASQIRSQMNQAVSAIRSGVSQMTSAWASMRFSTPHIRLPHFSVRGSLNPTANPPTVPTYSVSWYGQGGLFDGANLIGVGEKGPEYVLPLKASTLKPLASMLAEQGAGGNTYGPIYIGDEMLRDPDGSRAMELLAKAIDRVGKVG